MAEWAGCVAGAVERGEYLAIVREAGFMDVRIARERAYKLPEGSPFGLLSITVTGTK
jgi:hypothetical protein